RLSWEVLRTVRTLPGGPCGRCRAAVPWGSMLSDGIRRVHEQYHRGGPGGPPGSHPQSSQANGSSAAFCASAPSVDAGAAPMTLRSYAVGYGAGSRSSGGMSWLRMARSREPAYLLRMTPRRSRMKEVGVSMTA